MKKKHKSKTIITIIVLIVLVLLSIELYKNGKTPTEITNFYECAVAGNPIMESHPRQCRDPVSGKTFTEDLDELVGGQRDEHGCLGPAGYRWNDTYGLCVRQWELNETDKKILNVVKEYITEQYGLTYLYSVPEEDEGSFTVFLDTLGRPRTVDIYSWELINTTLTPEECTAKGGLPLNTVAGDTCKGNETNIGKVVGFISPNICCVPDNIHVCKDSQRNADTCITIWKPVCGYPLEETFSNSCLACSSERIEYYIEGECLE